LQKWNCLFKPLKTGIIRIGARSSGKEASVFNHCETVSFFGWYPREKYAIRGKNRSRLVWNARTYSTEKHLLQSRLSDPLIISFVSGELHLFHPKFWKPFLLDFYPTIFSPRNIELHRKHEAAARRIHVGLKLVISTTFINGLQVQWFQEILEAIVEKANLQICQNTPAIARTVSWALYFDQWFFGTLSSISNRFTVSMQLLLEAKLSNSRAYNLNCDAASARFGVNPISKIWSCPYFDQLRSRIHWARSVSKTRIPAWLFPNPISSSGTDHSLGSLTSDFRRFDLERFAVGDKVVRTDRGNQDLWTFLANIWCPTNNCEVLSNPISTVA